MQLQKKYTNFATTLCGSLTIQKPVFKNCHLCDWCNTGMTLE